MKDKPLVIFITLLGGAVSSICCILKGAGLLWTLFITLVTLVAFLIIGLIVNKMITEVKKEVAEKERLEAEQAKKEQLELELKAMEADVTGDELPDEQADSNEEFDDGSGLQGIDNTVKEEGV